MYQIWDQYESVKIRFLSAGSLGKAPEVLFGPIHFGEPMCQWGHQTP